MMRRIFSVATLLVCFTMICSGQTIPDTFEEVVPPKPFSDDWYKFNHSETAFSVSNKAGKLCIDTFRYSSVVELNISTGTLIGIDHGEFTGGLFFKPYDTTQKIIELKRWANVKLIFSFKEKIYFIEALAHGGTNSGTLNELDLSGGEFKFKKILDFESAPRCLTIYKDRLLVATYQNFYIVKDFQKELIFENACWKGLSPNSIAVMDDNTVFLGIVGGIVKLDPETKTLHLFKDKTPGLILEPKFGNSKP